LVCSYVCRSKRVLLLARVRASRITGVPDVSSRVKNFTRCEIYASGGGLLVEPMNAPDSSSYQ